MSKKCNQCKEIKSLDSFYKHKNNKDGRLSACKECHSKRVIKYAKDNPEKRRVYARNYARKNAEKINIKVALWRKNNPEEAKKRDLECRKKHKEKIKIASRKYRENNAEKIKASDKKYREGNVEKIKVSQVDYRNNNAEKIKEMQVKYKKNNAEKIKIARDIYRKNNNEKIKKQESVYREGVLIKTRARAANRYHNDPVARGKILERTWEYAIQHPEMVKSIKRLRAAILAGEIIKPDKCEVCKTNKKRIVGHVKNYYMNPPQPIFLCDVCHNGYHKGVSPRADNIRKRVDELYKNKYSKETS